MTARRPSITIGIGLLSAGLAALSAGQAAVHAGCFRSAISVYSSGTRPHSVTLADLDNDGDLDMITSTRGIENVFCGKLDPTEYCPGGALVVVKENLGDGTFGPFGNYQGGFFPRDVATGDVDGDGYLDLIVANLGYYGVPGGVSVLLNAGDGTFGGYTSGVHYESGGAAGSVAVGDLNGDGAPDIATDDVILINSGDGSFADGVPHGAAGVDVAIGDLNGDGMLDIVTGRDVLLNTGGGSFGPAAPHGGAGGHVILGDVNGDGMLDIVAGRDVLLNTGGGTLFAASQYDYVGLAALGDVDGDGDLDLIATSGGSGSIGLNAGDGTFVDQRSFPTGYAPSGIAVGDVDGDGDSDFVVTNAGYEEWCGKGYCHGEDDLWVYENPGNGSFGVSAEYGVGGQTMPAYLDFAAGSIAIADLDADGHLDVAVANGFGSDISVLLNAGNGTLEDEIRYDTGDFPNSVAVVDVNGDGPLDLVVGNAEFILGDEDVANDDVSVLINLGDGSFANEVRYPVGSVPWSVATGDVDGDGAPDIVTGRETLLNDGTGSFATPVAHGGSLFFVTLADLNGDDVLDLVGVGPNSYSGNVRVLLNAGGGVFGPQSEYAAGTSAWSLDVGDLDGDDDLDLVVANRGDFNDNGFVSGNVSVLLNNGDGTFANDVLYGAGNGPASIALGDIDRDGTLDIVAGASGSLPAEGRFTVLSNLGNGTFGSSQSFTPIRGTVAVGDLDGNGMLDVVATSGDTRITVVSNTCPVPCDTSVDCNDNGVSDCDEISLDPDLDMDGNNVIDTCETTCVADLDGSGSVGFGDLTQVLNAWGPCNSICECTTSQTTWQNESLGTFTGSFTMEFDHTPLLDSTDAAVMLGLSPLSGPTWDDYAILVRLDPNGYYNVRNADAYTFDAQVFYSAGVTNRIRIEADIAASTYSVWVTPDGGVETQIASNYAFRTSQQGITALDTLGVWSVDPDAFTVCDVEYGPTGALGSCPCLPDLDGNGSVGFADLTMLIAQWGACP